VKRRGVWLAACLSLCVATWLPPVPLTRHRPDLIVVVDITQSMNTLDQVQDGEPVSRLTRVKRSLEAALPALPCGSRLGLGLFTEYRTLLLFTPVEVCANAREVLEEISRLDGRMAWAGDSQIAKGLYSILRIARDLPDSPAVAFVTDGQESPPVNARHRPQFGGEPGAVSGWLIGVGGNVPMPIPKVDPDGRPAGFWRPDEVMQVDPYTRGRQGNAQNEAMPEPEPASPAPAALRGSPGSEHLSYLHEEYLQLLAAETRMEYRRLSGEDELAALFLDRSRSRPQRVPTDLRWIGGIAAFLALLAAHLTGRGQDPLF
jgi:mxaL protein